MKSPYDKIQREIHLELKLVIVSSTSGIKPWKKELGHFANCRLAITKAMFKSRLSHKG